MRNAAEPLRAGLALLLLLAGAAPRSEAGNEYGAPACAIADAEPETAGRLEIGLVSRQKVQGEDRGSFGLFEQHASAELAYFYAPMGPVSLTAVLNTRVPSGGELAGLPYQFGQLALHAQADWRTASGLTLRADALPGLYSDFRTLRTDAFAYPFGLSALQALGPSFSLKAGVMASPGFRRVWDPVFGLRWAPGPGFRADLAYPESALVWRPGPGWALRADLALRREFDYHMDDRGQGNRFRLKESRATLGADVAVAEDLALMIRAGQVFDRTLSFRRDETGALKVDDGFVFSFGLGLTF